MDQLRHSGLERTLGAMVEALLTRIDDIPGAQR